MNDQPWDLNQTWPVGRKRCRFTNAPRISEISGALPNFGAQKNIKFGLTELLFWNTGIDSIAIQSGQLSISVHHAQTLQTLLVV